MGTNLAPHHRMRAAVAAVALIAAFAAPLPAAGQVRVKSPPQDAVAEIGRFLPPVAPVPWLEARPQVPQSAPAMSRDGTSWSALLLTLRPASTWPSSAAHAASASHSYAGM